MKIAGLISIALRALLLVGSVSLPLHANATNLSLMFSGLISGSSDILDTSPQEATFVDQLLTISLDIMGDADNQYVSDVTFSYGSGSPFPSSFGASGYPADADSWSVWGVQSSVSIGMTGGSISISTTPLYGAEEDGAGVISIDYTLSSAHGLMSSYKDRNATGSGTTYIYVNDDYNPSIGTYDAVSQGSFQLSSVTQVVTDVPEPTIWALLIGGFGVTGAMVRLQRRRPSLQPGRVA